MGIFSTKQTSTTEVGVDITTNPSFVNNINVEAVGNGIVQGALVTGKALQDVAGAILTSGIGLGQSMRGSASTIALGSVVAVFVFKG